MAARGGHHTESAGLCPLRSCPYLAQQRDFTFHGVLPSPTHIPPSRPSPVASSSLCQVSSEDHEIGLQLVHLFQSWRKRPPVFIPSVVTSQLGP